MPGIGPVTAMAIRAFCPEAQNFENGRAFASSCRRHAFGVTLGLVPRQHSTG
jgi:transposase